MAKRSSNVEIVEGVKQVGQLSFSRKDLIGRGSFGGVFKGKLNPSTENKSEIDVAIKRIEIVVPKDTEKFEVVDMGKIARHPNVLPYYCIEVDADFIYIATELCAGTLKDIITGSYSGPPVGPLSKEMMLQIARGVQHLHKNKIVHRDIKPTNILVCIHPETVNPQMKLADFGLSRRVVKSDGTFTKCGTKGWQAPELCSESPSIKEEQDMFAVDIFSLGCVFAYALSNGNKHPFGVESLRVYRMENNEEMILTIGDFDPGFGTALFHLIRGMLIKYAGNRLTIEEVIEHLFFKEGINEEINSNRYFISFNGPIFKVNVNLIERSSEGNFMRSVDKRIGRLSYNRNDRIRTGSFETVFKGKFKESEEKIEIEVAIKRMEIICTNDVTRRVVEILEPHPNVLQYYCTEEDEDFIYFATELCAGTLEDIIKGNVLLVPGSYRDMVRQIVRGVEFLHKNGIVHRNIKPTNILVSFPDPVTNALPQVKLGGFGLCRIVKNNGSQSSFTKRGTRGWMAPEFYSKVPIQDETAKFAVDIFSLGCVFAYSLSKGNRHPFGSGNLRYYRIENNEAMILTVDDFDQHYGRALFDLIYKMLRPSASKRPTIDQVMRHSFFNEGINNADDLSILERLIGPVDYESLISDLNKLRVDIDTKNDKNRTPLMILCSAKKTSGVSYDGETFRNHVRMFLNLPNVADKFVNAKDNNGNTALTLLCEHYNDEYLINIIRLFIERGVNINEVIPIKNGFNALMLLCMQYNRNNLIDIIRLFIENRLDLNTLSTTDGWNLLHILCRYYDNDKLIDVLSLLVEKGIHLNATTTKDGWNATPFLCYYYTGNCMLEIIRLLIKNGLNIIYEASNGLNALGWVSYLYNKDDLIDIIKVLIDKDSSVLHCTSNETGSNPLLLVCYEEEWKNMPHNLIEIIRLLIESGSDVNCKTLDGWNALMRVCRYYRHENLIEIIEMLVGYGIEIHCKTNDGENAFLLLCRNENVSHSICLDVFRLLVLQLKADVSAVNEIDLDNALTTLCKYHYNCEKLVNIIDLILDDSSIDINHKNKRGEDAMSIIREQRRFIKNSEAILELFIKHGAVQ